MTLDFDFSVLYAIRDAFASGKADDLMRAITMLGDGGFIWIVLGGGASPLSPYPLDGLCGAFGLSFDGGCR